MASSSGVERLRRVLERAAARRRGLPEPQVVVRSPGLDFEFGDPAKPFHAASVGKVMTAIVVTRLIERGHFGFDTPIGKLLPARDIAGLPAVPGVDVGTEVTVEHLLTHTSGMPDYFVPPRGHDTAASASSAVAEPDRRWTPAELLDEVRRLPALGKPGGKFHYGDTGYVLLGRIAEEATGESLDALLRAHVYEPSGMVQSATPFASARTPADVAHLGIAPFWIGTKEMSTALAVSLDWAGGGIVTVPDDLVRFQRALHRDRLISREHLTHLARPRNRLRPGIHYGAGLVTLRFGEFFPVLLRGLPEPLGGLGAFATHMFYYPQQDAHVVINFHSTREMARSFQIAHIPIARLLAVS